MVTDGVIVILSYPDTVVRPAYGEFSSKIWPLFGVGTKDAVQAGHAALLLIHKEQQTVDYYDFGRYITSYGAGRVRSKETDVELEVPLKAIFKNNQLINIDELLLWLNKHPEKTHGSGRLVASVNTEINYRKAIFFIDKLIDEKEIPYGAFVKKGSNCARFVTDTIINSCSDKQIQLKLKTSNLFTPSPIGNVIKGTTENEILVVHNSKIQHYANRSVLKEYFSCFFNKFDVELSGIGTEFPDKENFFIENATWLGGIGSGAWFKMESVVKNTYKIARYTAMGVNDFKGEFIEESLRFNPSLKYQFIHPTNCKEVVVKQNNAVFLLKRIS
ncbi:hypothetical protein FHR24_000009 [Wenyingzhuangia heitensis]|uniref:Uncharacterized protein n=1 Tax=Wenyingzhuangia heitensis TaxID=1487859 RepID=A0ABX0U765_9FLAO|nr:DUF6695 family protein [Wenyingzhuangia heitensis]NIJ43570.1 hypothetical protein [Wenyingzhuangia heitensis]